MTIQRTIASFANGPTTENSSETACFDRTGPGFVDDCGRGAVFHKYVTTRRRFKVDCRRWDPRRSGAQHKAVVTAC